MTSSKKDKWPKFARIPTGTETCGFCIMLASKGFAYASEESARHAHAHCDCRIVPAYSADTVVEGYDPDFDYDIYSKALNNLRERGAISSTSQKGLISAEIRRILPQYNDCLATIGGREGLIEGWNALTKAQKQAYIEAHKKTFVFDGVGQRIIGAPYGRLSYIAEQVSAEIATRDADWFSGKCNTESTKLKPKYESRTAEYEFQPHEKSTAMLLCEHGFDVCVHARVENAKSPDARIGELDVDFKAPVGDSKTTVDNLVRKASHQADACVLHLQEGRTSMSVEKVEHDALISLRKRQKLQYVLIINYAGQLHRIKR